MLPLVSILIPAYNADEWIADTIRSALGQTWPQKEIIVVDDGSTDKTSDIVRNYECATVKLIQEENGGGCKARNRALKEAEGKYIQWLDADDLLAPDKIERQMAVARNIGNPYVLFSGKWATFYYRMSRARFEPTGLWQDLDSIEWLIMRMARSWIIPNLAWLVSRELTEMAGPWNERLAMDQDGEYFSRVVSICQKVKFVHESISYYRMSNLSSVSNSKSYKAWESLCLAVELTSKHVLERENSDRTRSACVSLLNRTASILEDNCRDLVCRIRGRIIELGGRVDVEKPSKRYTLTRGILGEKNARFIKEAAWLFQRRIYCSYDRLVAKLFE